MAQGIKWKKGDRVILNDLEFPANVYPFLNLKKEGVIVDFVKSKEGKVSAEEIIEAVKPETKVISISLVQFLTGYRADLEKIGKVCNEKGIIFSVDAIQGLGAVRVDVEKCYIDFLSAGTQKWLLGMRGLGFIHITEELQKQLEPKYVGWLSVTGAWDLLNYNLTLKNSAEAFQCGTISFAAVYALSASLGLLDEFGFDKVEKRVINNSLLLLERLEEIGVNTVLNKNDEKYLAGIISFKHPDYQKIFDSLTEKNIYCAVREGYVRLAPHFYNNDDDIIRVVKELAVILNN